jgi:hypothetical protein
MLHAILALIAVVAAIVVLWAQRAVPPPALLDAAKASGLPYSFVRRANANGVDVVVRPVCAVCGQRGIGRCALPAEFDLRALDPVAAKALLLHSALPLWRLSGPTGRSPYCSRCSAQPAPSQALPGSFP